MPKYLLGKLAGTQQAIALFDGSNGSYNFKLCLKTLASFGPDPKLTVKFGYGAGPEAERSFKDWIADPSASNLCVLLGFMMVFGWSIHYNNQFIREGSAQGRRKLNDVAAPAEAAALFDKIWPERLKTKRRRRTPAGMIPDKAELENREEESGTPEGESGTQDEPFSVDDEYDGSTPLPWEMEDEGYEDEGEGEGEEEDDFVTEVLS